MAAAEVLYGVTMDGDGTSTLLSVRFEEGRGPIPQRREAVTAAVGVLLLFLMRPLLEPTPA